MQIKGYSIVEKLYENPSIEVYRALRLSDNKRVVLKLLASEHPSPNELATLKHEYDLLSKLNLPGIIHMEALIPHQNSMVLVLEDIQGITLSHYLEGRPLDLEKFFVIAKQLIDVVESLHQQNIIHKDINPHNIIIEPNSLTTRLADLSIAAEIYEKAESQLSPYVLEGNLAYISPEQTGRMNRALDYRTDFYSLGVTFYEMLTGELPFKASDPIEWVHSHIAKIPPIASTINTNIPEIVALIIAKMLEKTPEERYSSFNCLRYDLNECMKQWQEKGHIDSFQLRQRVSSDHLYISQKLYGRDEQIELLLNGFERINKGDSELLLVAGYSGIGKTSLIQEIQKSIVRQHGYFITGKFDMLRRSIPYSAIIQACQSLINQILTEPDSRISTYREEIMAVLGINGQIIIDILPELEHIIGPQPPVVELQPAEAQNRFTMVFGDFFRVFTRPEHPVVMFLDDLQWADNSSLLLVENVLTDFKSHYLFIIGAYRDNEVKPDHYLWKTLQNIREVGIHANTIQLSELTEQNTEELIADTLNQDINFTKPLTQIIYSKTHGNPFFINQMLKVLYQEKLITFSYETNTWQWDLKKIDALSVTDNVIDLTIARLQKMPQETQTNLKLSACIGNQFDLQTLSIISQEPVEKLSENLIPALQEGLIKKIRTPYKQVGQKSLDKESIHEKDVYQFIHDRVQAASYELIPQNIRKKMHLQIARLLYKEFEKERTDQGMFEVLQHYNKSIELIMDEKEKLQVAALNLQAAQRAKRSISYHYALGYIKSGLDLLNDSYWNTNYTLIFNLYRERSECAYLIGAHEESEEYFDILLKHAQTNLEKADIYIIKVILYANRHEHEKSLTTGLEALKLLGVKLPLHPTYHILKDLILMRIKLAFKDISNLDTELKEASDPNIIVLSRLLMEMGPASYIANPKLLLLLSTKRILLNLKGGFSRYSITAYMTYALIVMTKLHDYKNTFALVELAGKLAQKENHLPTLSRYYTTLSLWFAHWRYPFAECVKFCKTAYRYAIDSGEALFAGYSQVSLTAIQFARNIPLPELLEVVEEMDETLHRTKDVGWYKFGVFLKTAILYWQGASSLTIDKIGKMIKKPIKAEARSITMGSHEIFSHLLFTFGHYKLALKHILAAYNLRTFVLGIVWNQDLYVMYAIIMAQIYTDATPKEKKEYKKTYHKLLKQVKEWVEIIPQNIEHKYFLMQAEWERINGNIVNAQFLYDKAIESAQEGEFTFYAAVANELASKFYAELNKPKFSKLYLLEAHYNYRRWGADAKCNLIEKDHPDWFANERAPLDLSVESVTSSSTSMKPHFLDFISVLKATQTISSEIILENLLRQMINIILENAGADRGLIILDNGDTLMVAAEGYASNQEVKLHQTGTINDRNDLPLKLISYVKNTLDEVVLSNAGADGRFMNDEYIITTHPKSILCIPIKKQQKLIGILYLENNLIQDAFKKDFLQVLSVLTTQAAISLENARLFTASEHFVPHAFLQQLKKESLISVKIGDNIHCERTVMFCDIRGFTSLSETVKPNEIFHFVNDFFAEMEPIIRQYRGFIDKYIGDAIMALFDNPDSAVQAAITMKNQLDKFNTYQKNQGKFPIEIGVGLNTGELILGIIGNETRMEGTVIGHAVNTASRIEELTKEYNASVLITENTQKKLMYAQHYALRLIDDVIIRGQTKPLKIFEVCAVDSTVVRNHKLASLEQFNAGIKLFRAQKFHQAELVFRSCLQPNIPDPVVEMYLKKCRNPYQE